MTTRKYYAGTAWQVDDVNTLRPKWSNQRCREFLQNNQNHIRDAMIENGWVAMEACLEWEKD